MKQISRILLVVLVLALLAPATVLAQDSGEKPCYGLEAADCELYYAMPEDPTSFAMAYLFNLTLNSGEENMELLSEGSGAWTLVEGAEDPLASFSLTLDTTNSLAEDTGIEEGAFNFRIVDGNMYFTMDDAEWMYANLGTLMESLSAESGMDLSALLADPEMAAEEMGGAMMDEEMLMAYGEDLAQYITASRVETLSVSGADVAVFETTIDLPNLLSDPAIGDLALQGLMLSDPEMADMSEEEMEMMRQQMPMLLGMVGMLFQDTALSVTNKIGVEDGMFYGFGVDFSLTLDPMTAAGMLGTSMDSEDMEDAEPLNLIVTMNVDVNDHGGSFDIVAPEGAEEIPAEELMGAAEMMQ